MDTNEFYSFGWAQKLDSFYDMPIFFGLWNSNTVHDMIKFFDDNGSKGY